MQHMVDDQGLAMALSGALADMSDVSDAAIVDALGQYLPKDAPDPQYGSPLEILVVGTASAGLLGSLLKGIARAHQKRLRLTLFRPEDFNRLRADVGSNVSAALSVGEAVLLKGHALSQATETH